MTLHEEKLETLSTRLKTDVAPVVSRRTLEILERRRRYPDTGHRGWLVRRLLLLADILGLGLAGLTAELLFGESTGGVLNAQAEFLLFLATLPIWIIGAKLYGLYDHDEERTDHSTADEIISFFHLVTVGSWLLWVFGWATHLFLPNPDKLATFWGLAIVLVGLTRIGARAIARRRPEYLQNALIYGTGRDAQLVARKLEQHPEYGINLVGFVGSGDDSNERIAGLPVLGEAEDVLDLADHYGVDRVVIACRADDAQLLELARGLNERDIQVDIVPRLHELVSPAVSIHTVEGVPLLGLPPFRLSNSSRLLKRTGDILVSGIALALLMPLFAVVAIAIKLDSRGPVFFKQTRRGAGGRLFSLYKFRTMVADAEERKSEVAHLNKHALDGGDPRMFKIAGDPRVTRVGHVLRRYMLDELPQLNNVLKGDMSLVGPRPLILEEDRYVKGWARKRLELKPGMTGLWQVLGRQAISFDEMVKLDYVYATTWSFGGDFRLLLRTIPIVLKGEGGSY
jgi:exopolysaccharide biosynthesis polyprenyl glycosylphosphotransferase